MENDPAISTSAGTPTAEPRRSGRRVLTLRVVAIVGGLATVAYVYGGVRWATPDSAAILALGFGLVLLAFAALAVVGVRAGVIAPFVVAALLLPWACAAAAIVGVSQRVGGALEDFSNEFSDSLSMEQPVEPLPQESETVTPLDEEILPSDEELFPSPPDDAGPAIVLGQPVIFEQELGGGEVAQWKVTVKGLECGTKSLPNSEYTEDGNLITATPLSGNTFCLVETRWTNAGGTEAGGATVLGNLMVGGEALERLDKDVYRGVAVMEQRDLIPMSMIKPGETMRQIDVFEVPDGVAPDAVWISRDQPKVLAALK